VPFGVDSSTAANPIGAAHGAAFGTGPIDALSISINRHIELDITIEGDTACGVDFKFRFN
jgi:hypothetical protein